MTKASTHFAYCRNVNHCRAQLCKHVDNLSSQMYTYVTIYHTSMLRDLSNNRTLSLSNCRCERLWKRTFDALMYS